jgi:hypothetical protein
MRQSKFTETQIVAILKRPMPDGRSMSSGGSTASVPRPTTSGKPNTGGWTSRM